MNNKNLMTTIMLGVALGIAVEKTASAAVDLAGAVISEIRSKRKEKK